MIHPLGNGGSIILELITPRQSFDTLIAKGWQIWELYRFHYVACSPIAYTLCNFPKSESGPPYAGSEWVPT